MLEEQHVDLQTGRCSRSGRAATAELGTGHAHAALSRGPEGTPPLSEAPLCGWETGVGSHRLPSGSPAASGAPFHLRPEERTPTTRPWGQHEPSGGFGTRPPAPATPGGPPDRATRQACACPSLCCGLAPRLPDRAADAATTARGGHGWRLLTARGTSRTSPARRAVIWQIKPPTA